ncbi:hypothetical protein D1T48_gp30 [Thermoproteus tenax virus 1]|uniref:Uncharacterized 7.4 kDa protein n=1 Tax=Thermoproteus tenax virus 1 (strain KRA1) TaxID=10480 RepID=YORR_TTV1K|nr:hypothetical protein D1T48_gp30 [Thermoproteus tenax virus 1]P19302.1 RecName: Full=Uncharacterized 7.4 kDa protein [Thermoproteus tenax virus 1 (STRAIN KRA1)]CAA32998.1 unnamed protein product [Thermoproteus tenax virus 1]
MGVEVLGGIFSKRFTSIVGSFIWFIITPILLYLPWPLAMLGFLTLYGALPFGVGIVNWPYPRDACGC